MSTKWDALTPEQQRAIGTAALALDFDGKTFNASAFNAVRDAVRAAECPTWSVNEGFGEVICSDGRFVKCHVKDGTVLGDLSRRLLAAALNAHEREKWGLK